MATKAAALTEDRIIGLYMTDTLENDAFPRSVFKFCKTHKLQETEFYDFFGSFEALQERIWARFFGNTRDLLEKNPEYANYTNREKMLTFFYTFFEVLTLNRSYVLFALSEEGDQSRWQYLRQLKGLRSEVREFARELIEEGNSQKGYRLTQRSPRIFAEGAWVQLMFLLKFWMEDRSGKFEKTDLAIEKSVNTIFDVFDNTPLESILDFGKFLYKESGI